MVCASSISHNNHCHVLLHRCGFARSQEAYNKAFDALFSALDRAEALLSKQRYLVGGVLTEADVRLFTTLVRFDPVYFTHFKCNWRRLKDYHALWCVSFSHSLS